MTIEEYLCQYSKPAGTLSTIADEMALDNVDYVSIRNLAGELRRLGWEYKNTGKLRVWIKPGQTAVTAGLSKPANIRFVVGRIVSDILAGVDSITVDELHDAVKSRIGEFDVRIANDSMIRRAKRKEWAPSQVKNTWIKIVANKA